MISPVKVGKDNPSTDQVLFVHWEATEHSQVRKVIMRKNENKNINLKWLKLWKVFNTINWRGTTHFVSEDDHCSGCRNVSSVTVNNSPIVFRTTFTRTIILNLLIRRLRWITELCAILLVKKNENEYYKIPNLQKSLNLPVFKRYEQCSIAQPSIAFLSMGQICHLRNRFPLSNSVVVLEPILKTAFESDMCKEEGLVSALLIHMGLLKVITLIIFSDRKCSSCLFVLVGSSLAKKSRLVDKSMGVMGRVC